MQTRNPHPVAARLHCERHHTHDVNHLQAAQIVAALAAEVVALREDPPEVNKDGLAAWPPCPLDALSWAHDGEMYGEYVEARLLGNGIARIDDDEGLVLAAAESDEKAVPVRLDDGSVTLSSTYLRYVAEALNRAAVRCPYHGTELERAGMQWGEPWCDSCKQPWRIERAREAVRAAVAAALARPPGDAT